MSRIRVKGFKIFNDRHGKPRCYHRATGMPIDLGQAPLGSAEFFAACARISALGKASDAPKPGTLGLLISKYREIAFGADSDLAPRTRADYQRVFDYLKPIQDTPLAQFNRALVVRIRDTARRKGRRFANYVKAVLSIIFSFGVERDYLKANPAEGIKNIKRDKDAAQANRPWSDAERHVVLQEIPAHMKPSLAVMMFTGLAPKDALKLPKTFYHDGEIAARRSKTGEPVFWPAPQDLITILENAPSHGAITLCANSRGRPWTVSGFSASFRKFLKNLERDGKVGSGLTLYGLRHTVAVILREIGYDERTIADALGQKTIEMARHYARGADLKPKMRGVVSSLNEELNRRRTKTVKPAS
jgi:integrase